MEETIKLSSQKIRVSTGEEPLSKTGKSTRIAYPYTTLDLPPSYINNYIIQNEEKINEEAKEQADEEVVKLEVNPLDYDRSYYKSVEYLKKPDVSLVHNIGVGHTLDTNSILNMKFVYYGRTTELQRTPNIARSYEEFTELIESLFGKKPETPTLIPALIVFQFELDLSHYNNNFEISKNKEYYEDDDGNPFAKKNAITKNSVERIKSINKLEKTGLSCIDWLIENNYIPAYYSINTDEDIVYQIMIERLNDWRRKNNYYI